MGRRPPYGPGGGDGGGAGPAGGPLPMRRPMMLQGPPPMMGGGGEAPAPSLDPQAVSHPARCEERKRGGRSLHSGRGWRPPWATCCHAGCTAAALLRGCPRRPAGASWWCGGPEGTNHWRRHSMLSDAKGSCHVAIQVQAMPKPVGTLCAWWAYVVPMDYWLPGGRAGCAGSMTACSAPLLTYPPSSNSSARRNTTTSPRPPLARAPRAPRLAPPRGTSSPPSAAPRRAAHARAPQLLRRRVQMARHKVQLERLVAPPQLLGAEGYAEQAVVGRAAGG